MKRVIVLGRYDEKGSWHAFLKNRRGDSRVHVTANEPWKAVGMLVDQNPELFGVEVVDQKLAGNEAKEAKSLLKNAMKNLSRSLNVIENSIKREKSARRHGRQSSKRRSR